MSGRIGRYTYKNESVLKEFLGKLFKALGSRKAKQIRKQLSSDPEMIKIVKSMDTQRDRLAKKIAKKRKQDPEYDKRMKSLGL
jgi:DNA topoisomerase VI subunit B|tara:strand:- start:118 stop:366 length:249 start_codon:yes stop_codon:yes gene_type:complete